MIVKEVLKKEIIVNAKDTNEALDIIRNKYMKDNLKDFKNENMCEVDARIIEENGKIIEDESYEDDEKYNTKMEEIDARLDRIEAALVTMIKMQEYIENKIELIDDFVTDSIELLEDINENLEEGIKNLIGENEEIINEKT